MPDLILNNSGYQTGSIDTATVLVNNVSPIDARHVNGPASAIVQIETILGSGTTLKGATADLAARLSVLLNSLGQLQLTGFAGLVTDRGLLATSSTAMTPMNHTPVGMLSPYAGASAPVNWLLCDGSAVSRTTYAKLFAVISTTYGSGDGSTTFNVPDLRGRTIIMVDGSANRITSASTNGANADTLGGVGGAQTHTLTNSEAPSHGHTGAGTILVSDTLGSNTAIQHAANSSTVGGDLSLGTTLSVASSGGGGAHSNTQPWMALNYIIFTAI